MSAFTDIINAAKNAETLHDKSQLLTYLGRALSSSRKKLSYGVRDEVSDFALLELESIPALLNKAPCYREKDEIFDMMDSLMNLVMICFDSPAAMPPDKLEMVRRVVDRCNRERFLENAVDEVFREQPGEADVERILCMVVPLKDEFHKGQLWRGLIHYGEQVKRLNNNAKAVLIKYAVSELSRYAEEQANGTITKDGYENQEFICDAAKFIMTGTPVDYELNARIAALFALNDPTVSYFALSTLVSGGYKVPDEVIVMLANNLEYADRTYDVLAQANMTSRFPAELCDPVYLAKSHLVSWLTYPTELGKAPDAIEFIGQTKKKGEVFHIFRYKSDSENLGDDLKGVWLIGWAGNDGGTFSNFDKYADYEQKTPEKTVRYILRKLL